MSFRRLLGAEFSTADPQKQHCTDSVPPSQSSVFFTNCPATWEPAKGDLGREVSCKAEDIKVALIVYTSG